MDVLVLGGHQVESTSGRPISFLIDGTIALDAGGITGALSLDEQTRIAHILVTHYHFDHIRDLPFLGLAALDRTPPHTIDVYCSQLVQDILRKNLLNDVLWLDFFVGPISEAPTFRHRLVKPGKPFRLGKYEVLPLDNRHHAVPVIGYQIATPDGKRFLYTGDTGPGIRELWPHVDPDVLVTEVTWPDARSTLVGKAGHLTPALLEVELTAFRDLKGYMPRVLVCHVNQAFDAEVADEVADVARRLHASIEIVHEGMRFQL